MNANVGRIDKLVRVAIGVVALFAAFALGFGTVGGIIFIVVAAIALVTAAIGFCPLYRLFGINTCSTK